MLYSANYCLLVTQHNQLTEMWIVKLPLGEVNLLLRLFSTMWGQRPEFLISRMVFMVVLRCDPQCLHISSDAIHPSPSWSPPWHFSWHSHVTN